MRIRMPRRRSLCGAQLASWVVLAWIGTAQARTWYITPDATGDAPTIQAGIDSAQAGDVVLLAPGTYTWTSQGASGFSMLHMKADVTLRGEAGAQATIVDAETKGRVLRCQDVGTQMVIEGLTIRNGWSTFELGGPRLGGGMNVSGSSEPTIRDCVFQDNVAPSAGGPSSKGGAICCDLATIDRCTFLNNRAFGQGDGGAVACGAAQITDCVFEGNRVGGDPDAGGGAIVSAGATIQRCTFRNNSAGGFMVAVGGAVWEHAGGSITSCVFDGNSVTAADLNCNGGAVSVRGSVSDCLFINNVAQAGFFAVARGGAITAGSSTISRSVFVGNVAHHTTQTNPDGAGYGGAISSTAGNLVIENCTMYANSGGFSNGVSGFYALAGGNTVVSTIIAGGIGRACGGDGAAGTTWSCCDIFGNSDDSLCGTDGGGNFSAHPQFCDSDPLASLNVSIQSDSPCADGNHPNGASCGLIGPAPIGCETVSVESKTWGAVKSLYRD